MHKDVVVAREAFDCLIQRVADEKIAQIAAGLRAIIGFSHPATGKASVKGRIQILDGVFHRDLTRETIGITHHDEILAIKLGRAAADIFDRAEGDLIIEVNIAVIGDEIRNTDHPGRVETGKRKGIIGDLGVVVDRDHDDIDSTDVTTIGIVRHLVAETGRGFRVQIGRKDDIAIRIEPQRTIDKRLWANRNDFKNIAVDIRVIGQQIRGWNDGFHVFIDIDNIVARNRRCIANIFEPHRHARGIGQPLFVPDQVIERGIAPEIRIRHKAKGLGIKL